MLITDTVEPEDLICEAIRHELGYGEWDKNKLAIDLYDPDWSDRNFVRNWKNYIPQRIKETWNHFSNQTKIAFFFMALKRADAENWD